MPNRSIFWKSDFSKILFLARFYRVFWRFRVAKVDRKSIRNPSKIDARKSHAKWSQNHQKWCQNGPKINPISLQNRSKNRFKNRCEICGPKIDQKSSLGAPKGRQGDFGYSAERSFQAAGVPKNSQKERPLDSKTATLGEGIPTRPRAEGPANWIFVISTSID